MCETEPRRIHRHHGEFAMGEIDHTHDTENHRKSERHQPIDEAGEDALNHNAEINGRGHYVRPCHGGIGSTGASVAAWAGHTTVGVRLRLCTAADGIPVFWPLASNRIGGPIITCLATAVERT